MAVVDQSSVDVPLSLFSSLDTELSPPDIPEGISPDNQDIVYLPGSVSTRPGLKRRFVSELLVSGTVTYEKSFVAPDQTVKNLYLTNDGTLWVEDETNTPGVATELFTSSASIASSVTAFGREYIALSDGKHGADIPIQYDGTNLWRVTQDGPGEAPTVTSIALPSTTLAIGSVTPAQTVVSLETTGETTVYHPPPIGFQTYYTTITVVLANGSILPTSGTVTIAGATALNGTYNFLYAVDSVTFVCAFYSSTYATATGGTATYTGGATLVRTNNQVSAVTSAAHGLAVGYQAQISGIPASTVGGAISSIVLANKDNPGIATVTTSSAHGLLPNNTVNIQGVNNTTVGTAISTLSRTAQISTVTMSAAHGLQAGSIVFVTPSVAGNVSFKGQWQVIDVPTTTTFTYAQVDADFAAAADAGSVTYVWPLANINPELNYFTVLTSPTSTSFTIALSYTDGTWTGGTVTFAWDGIFYVTSVPSATSFTYQQYGPNATTSTAGKVTPYGQITPGIHQCQMCFLLESGAITAPSPPVTFVANGGQYLSIGNMLTGPSNVAARILLFTGAGGAYFFYIPQPAQVNGLIVSTATQIDNNTATTAVVDFADATLYAAVGCSIPGNNLAAQVVLGPCAGFFTYASRLQAWGEYNKVQNFLNMGFDGGIPISPATIPPGWTFPSTGSLVASRLGLGWQIPFASTGSVYGTLKQNAYADSNGNTILLPNTKYQIRCWAKSNQGTYIIAPEISALIQSTVGGWTLTATVLIDNANTQGKFYTAVFSGPTPAVIPPDTVFTIGVYGASNTGLEVILDEIEVIYAEEPYLNQQERISYVDNPEGFDGLTGVLGPQDDNTPIMNHGVIRDTLYLVTGGSLYETSDNRSTEPSGWSVAQVADNCGAWSIASVGRNAQGIGSAGPEWMAWSGPVGAQIFTGRQPAKISQEIQTIWDAIYQPGVAQAWTKNDQPNKRCYFGVPVSATKMQVLVMDYRNLDGESIATMPPVRISFTGKMIASDLTRKWTRWNINAYCGEMMYTPGFSSPQMTFGGGFGGTGTGANVYTLDSTKYSDDDAGIIPSYYTTYFFVSHEMEQALQLGSRRKEFDYIMAFVGGVGTISFTPLVCSLTNPQAATPNFALTMDPKFDIETDINVITTRCAFKIAPSPLVGQTDAYFSLQKLVVMMKKAPWQPVRGSGGGSY